MKSAYLVGASSLLMLLVPQACTDSNSNEFKGRIFVAPLNNSSGEFVGLAVDYLPVSGSRDEIELVEVKIVSPTAHFIGVKEVNDCIRMPSSGRMTLIDASGSISASERVFLAAYAPVEDLSTQGEGGAGGGNVGGTRPPPTCTGALLDDVAWPTTGAKVVQLPEGGAGNEDDGGDEDEEDSGDDDGGSSNQAGANGS